MRLRGGGAPGAGLGPTRFDSPGRGARATPREHERERDAGTRRMFEPPAAGNPRARVPAQPAGSAHSILCFWPDSTCGTAWYYVRHLSGMRDKRLKAPAENHGKVAALSGGAGPVGARQASGSQGARGATRAHRGVGLNHE